MDNRPNNFNLLRNLMIILSWTITLVLIIISGFILWSIISDTEYDGNDIDATSKKIILYFICLISGVLIIREFYTSLFLTHKLLSYEDYVLVSNINYICGSTCGTFAGLFLTPWIMKYTSDFQDENIISEQDNRFLLTKNISLLGFLSAIVIFSFALICYVQPNFAYTEKTIPNKNIILGILIFGIAQLIWTILGLIFFWGVNSYEKYQKSTLMKVYSWINTMALVLLTILNIASILAIYIIGIFVVLVKAIKRTTITGYGWPNFLKPFLFFVYIFWTAFELVLLTFLACIYIKWNFVQMHFLISNPNKCELFIQTQTESLKIENNIKETEEFSNKNDENYIEA